MDEGSYDLIGCDILQLNNDRREGVLEHIYGHGGGTARNGCRCGCSVRKAPLTMGMDTGAVETA